MCLKETFIFLKGGYKLQLCIRADYVTLGEQLIGTTLSIYAHAFQKSRAEALEAVANVLDNRRKKSG